MKSLLIYIILKIVYSTSDDFNSFLQTALSDKKDEDTITDDLAIKTQKTIANDSHDEINNMISTLLKDDDDDEKPMIKLDQQDQKGVIIPIQNVQKYPGNSQIEKSSEDATQLKTKQQKKIKTSSLKDDDEFDTFSDNQSSSNNKNFILSKKTDITNLEQNEINKNQKSEVKIIKQNETNDLKQEITKNYKSQNKQQSENSFQNQEQNISNHDLKKNLQKNQQQKIYKETKSEQQEKINNINHLNNTNNNILNQEKKENKIQLQNDINQIKNENKIKFDLNLPIQQKKVVKISESQEKDQISIIENQKFKPSQNIIESEFLDKLDQQLKPSSKDIQDLKIDKSIIPKKENIFMQVQEQKINQNILDFQDSNKQNEDFLKEDDTQKSIDNLKLFEEDDSNKNFLNINSQNKLFDNFLQMEEQKKLPETQLKKSILKKQPDSLSQIEKQNIKINDSLIKKTNLQQNNNQNFLQDSLLQKKQNNLDNLEKNSDQQINNTSNNYNQQQFRFSQIQNTSQKELIPLMKDLVSKQNEVIQSNFKLESSHIDDLNQRINYQQNLIDQKLNENKEFKEKNRILLKEVQRTQEELQDYELQKQKKQSEVSLQSQFSDDIGRFFSEVKEMKENSKKAFKKLQSTTQNNTKIENQAQNEIGALKNDIISLNDEKLKIIQLFKDEKIKFDQEEQDMTDSQKKLQEITEQVTKIRQDIDFTTRELENTDQKEKDSFQQIMKLQQEINKETNIKQVLEQKLSSLDIDQQQKIINQLNQEIKTIKDDIEYQQQKLQNYEFDEKKLKVDFEINKTNLLNKMEEVKVANQKQNQKLKDEINSEVEFEIKQKERIVRLKKIEDKLYNQSY